VKHRQGRARSPVCSGHRLLGRDGTGGLLEMGIEDARRIDEDWDDWPRAFTRELA